MAYTADSLSPGQEITVSKQGTAITPIQKVVIIHWVGPKAVHYRFQGENKIQETSLDRFLEIINS